MKVFNELMISAFIFCLILSIKVNADEGWWSLARITGGSLYSKIEHPEIALEKEVLIYKGEGECELHFLFNNISKRKVIVEVGFPVKITIPLKFDIIDRSKYLLEKIYGEDLVGLSWSPGQDTVDQRKLKRTVRQFISFIDFQNLNTIIEGTGERWVDIAIIQDGTKIDIDSVLIESQLKKDDTVVVHFHFLHQLFFQPNRISNVQVKYSSNCVVMAAPAEPCRVSYIVWRYIMGTGKTWRGSIENIYILVPEHLDPNLPVPFSFIGNNKNYNVFIAKNYEPLEEDEIDIKYMKFMFKDYDPKIIHCVLGGEFSPFLIKSIDKPKTPAQNFVVLKDASSYLIQTTWTNSFLIIDIPQEDPIWNALFKHSYYTYFYENVGYPELSYVSESVPATCKNIDFGPLSLFDGIPESAWCEGAKGDGIGEWVEFELTADIFGLSIYNGFRKGRWYQCGWDSLRISNLLTKYIDNNRIKLLEVISNDEGVKQKIELEDTPLKQKFDQICLPKGIYKIYIREIYKGEKWEDTCLGEIIFHSASAKSVIENDEYLKNVLKNF